MITTCLCGHSLLLAQGDGNGTKTLNRVIIESQPRGALVEVAGEYSFVGRTPFVIPYALYGEYTIKAKKAGYENVHTSINLHRRAYNKLTIRLSRRTPVKAAYRSALLPGWGQFYGQNKLRGAIISGGQAALVIAAAISEHKFRKQKGRYDQALLAFQRVQNNLVAAEAAYKIVQKEFSRAEDAGDLRNTFFLLNAGFWVYNILDAIFFSSGNAVSASERVSAVGRTSFSGKFDRDRAMLTMRVGL